MNLPPEFVQRIYSDPLINADAFMQSLETDSPVSIRLNPGKKSNIFENVEKIPWCSDGRYLPERPKFTLDPLLHAGGYYVQEASSMFLDFVLKNIPHQPGLKFLDLCAAPGGKSTLLAANLGDSDLLVSNEVISNRVNPLIENMVKWGNPNIIITQNDPDDFSGLNSFFDVIVADVPCSGEGLFRKNPDATKEWSVKNTEMCALRQRRILKDIYASLKPGGFLIYSTCTFNPDENIRNVSFAKEELGLESVKLPIPHEWKITEIEENGLFGYAFYPHLTNGEGFFCACLQKPENVDTFSQISTSKRNSGSHFKSASSEIFTDFLTDFDSFEYREINENIFAFPESVAKNLPEIRNFLKVRYAGLKCGTLKGKDFIPSHESALSQLLSIEIPKVEINLEDSLTYLRCENIRISSEIPNGFTLATFQSLNLGWFKNLGNRINNRYPKEWRIRMR